MSFSSICSRLALAGLLLGLLLLLCGCTAENKNDAETIATLSQLDAPDKTVGVSIGTASVTETQQFFQNATVNVLTSNGFLELQSGNIDAYAAACSSLEKALASGSLDGMLILDEDIGNPIQIVAGISRKTGIPGLRGEINAFLTSIQQDGTMDDIYRRWIQQGSEEMPDIPAPEHPTRTLIVGTTGLTAPFSFYVGQTLTGMDIELIRRLALYMNAALEIRTYDFYGILTALETGACDCAFSNLNATPERAEVFDFSIPVYTTYTRALVMDRNAATNEISFTESLRTSFEKTFIREGRWQLILSGMQTTLFISCLAVLFGTLLGFVLCLLRGSDNPLLRALTSTYILLLQGTPLVVLLMILFYIVFSGTGISGVWVAILAFALNFSAYACEIFRSGIDAIDRGQTEAALAIGYSRARAFTRVVLPQAAMSFFPVYKGQVISLIKMTSIVGYISVQDLTKASDIIRSRTYEAFFPLIATALLYFALSWLLAALLSAVQLRLEPNRKHRTVKGVTMK